MPTPPVIENTYLKIADTYFARRPQPVPPPEKLNHCKIIAHRGEHRAGGAEENTLAAFDRAARAGVWGIELDVRWTRDLIPVVAHDPDMRQPNGQNCDIARTTYAKLAKGVPALTTLEEVVARFGARLHLMIEIKPQAWIDRLRQGAIISDVLLPLEPAIDYHVLSLTPQLLADLPKIAPQAKAPIAYYLPDRISRQTIQNQWGGLCGHYLMMRRAIILRHKAHGQQVGTGFANSVNTLWRELNRGIDWIFSDNASRLQGQVTALLDQAK